MRRFYYEDILNLMTSKPVSMSKKQLIGEIVINYGCTPRTAREYLDVLLATDRLQLYQGFILPKSV